MCVFKLCFRLDEIFLIQVAHMLQILLFCLVRLLYLPINYIAAKPTFSSYQKKSFAEVQERIFSHLDIELRDLIPSLFVCKISVTILSGENALTQRKVEEKISIDFSLVTILEGLLC